jgi:O-antigen/teichoic acid export membrane protein
MSNPSKNSFIMFFVFAITAASNYFYNVSMGWFLTPEQYGILGVSISFTLILSLFITSAFPLTSTKYISGNYAENIKHQVFKSSLVVNILIGILVSLIFYLTFSTQIIDLGSDYSLLVLGVVFATITSSAMVIYQGLLQGVFRFKSFGLANIVTVLGKLFSALLLVSQGYGAFGALMGIPIGNLLTVIIVIYLARDFKFWKTKGWADSSVYFFALPMFFGTLGTTMLLNIDIIGVKFLTDGMLSDTLAGYYRASLILAQLPIFLVGAMMGVLFPYISKYADNEVYPLKSIKYAAVFILPLSVTIAAIPESIISLIFPDVYIQAAPALQIISLGMGFLVMTMVVTQIFQARHAPRIPAIVLPLAVVIEIIALLLLVPSYGIEGAAFSTTIGCAFAFVVLIALYVNNYQLSYNYSMVVKTIVSLTFLAGSLMFFPHATLVDLLVDILLSGILYIFLLSLFNILIEEDLEIVLLGLPSNIYILKVAEPTKVILRKLNNLGL